MISKISKIQIKTMKKNLDFEYFRKQVPLLLSSPHLSYSPSPPTQNLTESKKHKGGWFLNVSFFSSNSTTYFNKCLCVYTANGWVKSPNNFMASKLVKVKKKGEKQFLQEGKGKRCEACISSYFYFIDNSPLNLNPIRFSMHNSL